MKRVLLTASAVLLFSSTATAAVPAHQAITSYDGPNTCIGCHEASAYNMLDSLHMQWSGPTPDLTNTNGEDLGKAVAGINSFCTYAMSSGGACFGCHVRADGNAPHAPDVNDVDCLMCHNDAYQRSMVPDLDNPVTVTDYLGNEKDYVFGAQDADGNYSFVPKLAEGMTMVDLARGVHLPTRTSCLRCHAKAGGGDWTKRGDMGLSTKNPAISEDVHMSPAGADLSCQACHATGDNHKVGGRGIDLRQTEAPTPTCSSCHGSAPHGDDTINRHAQGQVSCQVCHIKTFGKGGATEMSRDWLSPHWNPAFCNGQGGYVGHEVKVANVKPDYRWFDGTSYVYNVGEAITANADGTYTMAKANGKAFDGNSKIVPIKDHWTVMPLHESGELIAPKIMNMFMTGDFDQAVQAGMADQGLTGNYTMVDANAEMLISHGVDQKSNAPTCTECHDLDGATPDGTKMLNFGELGYHTWPAKIKNCTLCHHQEELSLERMHEKHAKEMGKNCVGCHTTEPTGWIEPVTENGLCNNCHDADKADKYFNGQWEEDERAQKLHEEHAEEDHGMMETTCTDCHTF